jgi:hypothetical protein
MRLKKQHKIKRSNTICQMALDKKKADKFFCLPTKRLEGLGKITDIQCSNGNWNYDPYMHGLANGMILSLATLLGEEPYFKRAPEKWLNAVKKALCRGDNDG